MAYELYWFHGSPYAWTALLGLEIKKIPYTNNILQASKREHKSQDFLALNPRGKVPALKHNDAVMYESIAILAYLEEIAPTPPIFGETPQETGLIWQRTLEISNYICPPLILNTTRQIFLGFFDEEAHLIDQKIDEARQALEWIEQTLTQDSFMAGANISAADLVLLPYVKAFERAITKPAGEALGRQFLPFGKNYPHLNAWLTKIEAMAEYDATYPPNWREA